MSVDQGTRVPPAGLLLALAYAPIVIAVAGGVAGSTSTERIVRPAQFTSAMVHGFAAVTFAVIFGISAVIVAAIVTARLRDAPASFRGWGFLPWQGAVVGLGIGWAATVALTVDVNPIEMALGAGIAAASIGACIQASRRDPASSERRARRLSARREARSPHARRVARVLQIGIPSLLVAAAIGGIGVAQVAVVEHRDCTIVGWDQVNGVSGFTTAECGSFQLDTAVADPSDVQELLGGTPVDVTSRGWALGIPPRPVAISVRPSASD